MKKCTSAQCGYEPVRYVNDLYSKRCPSPLSEDVNAIEGMPSPRPESLSVPLPQVTQNKRREAPRQATVYQHMIAKAIYSSRNGFLKLTVIGMHEVDEDLVTQQLAEGMKAYKGSVQKAEWRESGSGKVLDVVVSGTVAPPFDPTKNREEKRRKEQKVREKKERRQRQQAEKDLVDKQGADDQGCGGQLEDDDEGGVGLLIKDVSELQAGSSTSAEEEAKTKSMVLSEYVKKFCSDDNDNGPGAEEVSTEQQVFSKRITFCNPREDSDTGEVVILIQRDLEHRDRVQGQ